jgi:MoaA/NifB/PqqE/SkfB family radical SAM enzyme
VSQYGFRDRLTAAFPSQIIVDATEVCNLACIHCPHPEFKKSPQYDARYLDADLHRKMVDEVLAHGQGSTQYIRYTSNGEPLVHPKIYDMLDYAVGHSKVFVTLTTNGTIMNEKRIGKLLSSGLHMVDISIDAHTPETYAKIRVNGDLDVTRRNILTLLRIRKELQTKTRVVVSFVEQPENAGEAPAFEQYWKEQGVDYVIIRRLHSAAGGVVKIAASMLDRQRGVQRRACLYPWERILLTPRGDLAFCPQDWLHGSVIADYRDTTIREVWQGEAYRKLREAHLSNDYSAHGFCGQCPDWQQTRWPGEGRSYADLVSEMRG